MSEPGSWILIPFAILGTLIPLLFIASVIGFVREMDPIQSNKHFKLLFLTSLVIGISVPWSFYSVLELRLQGKSESDTELIADLISVGILGWGAVCSIVLIIFGLRIIRAFKNTKHEMGRVFSTWLFVLIFIIFSCLITAVSALIADKDEIATIGGSIAFMFSTINGIIMLIVFINKLNKVIADFLIQFGAISGETMIELNLQLSAGLQAREEQQGSGFQVDIDVGSTSNGGRGRGGADSDTSAPAAAGLDKNMVVLNNIIADMIKYTILIGVAMSSTSTAAIFVPIVRSLNQYISFSYLNIVVCIDILINEICLLLQFKMSRKYYKLLCKECIVKCQQRQTRQINNNIKNMERVTSVELKVLPSGGIGVDSVKMADQESNVNYDQDEDKGQGKGNAQDSVNDHDNTPAVKTMQSVEMQLN